MSWRQGDELVHTISHDVTDCKKFYLFAGVVKNAQRVTTKHLNKRIPVIEIHEANREMQAYIDHARKLVAFSVDAWSSVRQMVRRETVNWEVVNKKCSSSVHN